MLASLVILTLLSLAFSQEQPEDPCEFLERTVNYHVANIPYLLEVGLEKAKKELSFSVSKYNSYAFAIYAAVITDVWNDWKRHNKTLGNMLGSDVRKRRGHYKNMYLIGATGADGLAYQLVGIQKRPEDLDKCACKPEDFLRLLDTWQVLHPDLSSFEEAIYNYGAFVSLASSNMSCFLNLRDSYIEVARVRWALQQLFSALELRLSSCVFDEVAPKLLRKKASISAMFRRK